MDGDNGIMVTAKLMQGWGASLHEEINCGAAYFSWARAACAQGELQMADINGDGDNNHLVGTDGNDVINGLGGNDKITGGLGDDTMTGGDGNDNFVFNFEVEGGAGGNVAPPQSFADWFAENAGKPLGDGITQNEFSVQYTAWLENLAQWLDDNLDGFTWDGTVGLNQNDASDDATPYIGGLSAELAALIFGDRTDIDLKTGKTTHERFYSDFDVSFMDEINAPVTITASDGNDIITDFSREGGRDPNNDHLSFEGMTLEQFQALVDSGDLTVTNTATDTVIDWGDGSITLQDTQYTLAQITDFIAFDA